MAIYGILESIEDVRKGSNECDFNGYLEDYLDTIEQELPIYPSLKELFEIDNDLKIVVNLNMSINKETISNQIIRYKDIFKLKGEPIKCPYIIYSRKDDKERALLLTEDDYIYAKGIYYCMTEPFNKFQEAKNEIVAISTRDQEHLLSVFKRLFVYRAGALQREIDRKNYATYEDSKTRALQLAENLKESAVLELEAVADEANQEKIIYYHIVNWFLLKKYLYVQYMVNKDILKEVHEGNVKKQRNQAKRNADEVSFMSFSDMWKSTIHKPIVENIEPVVELSDEPVVEPIDEPVDEIKE